MRLLAGALLLAFLQDPITWSDPRTFYKDPGVSRILGPWFDGDRVEALVHFTKIDGRRLAIGDSWVKSADGGRTWTSEPGTSPVDSICRLDGKYYAVRSWAGQIHFRDPKGVDTVISKLKHTSLSISAIDKTLWIFAAPGHVMSSADRGAIWSTPLDLVGEPGPASAIFSRSGMPAFFARKSEALCLFVFDKEWKILPVTGAGEFDVATPPLKMRTAWIQGGPGARILRSRDEGSSWTEELVPGAEEETFGQLCPMGDWLVLRTGNRFRVRDTDGKWTEFPPPNAEARHFIMAPGLKGPMVFLAEGDRFVVRWALLK